MNRTSKQRDSSDRTEGKGFEVEEGILKLDIRRNFL